MAIIKNKRYMLKLSPKKKKNKKGYHLPHFPKILNIKRGQMVVSNCPFVKSKFKTQFFSTILLLQLLL